MDLWNYCGRTAVPISIDRKHFLITLQQHIVHAPGIDRQTFDLRVFPECFHDTCNHVRKELAHIPRKMAVLLPDTVRETKYFVSFDFAILLPAYNMPTGGCSNIYC